MRARAKRFTTKARRTRRQAKISLYERGRPNTRIMLLRTQNGFLLFFVSFVVNLLLLDQASINPLRTAISASSA
jgi:hypothetical protein